MKIRFLGAAGGTITGSCTHFYYPKANFHFLVDCGALQGEPGAEHKNKAPFPFDPAEIAFVLLTHAHLDHCGLVPKLYRDGFQGKVYCTAATARLAKASLVDGAKFASESYTRADVEAIRFHHVDEGQPLGSDVRLGDKLVASFRPTAHILGSCSIRIQWLDARDQPRQIVMSGDLGNNTTERQYQTMMPVRQGVLGRPDAIVVESTYGGRRRSLEHRDATARRDALRRVIQEEVFDKRALVVIPAFALQRTQEVLLDLYAVLRQHFSGTEVATTPRAHPRLGRTIAGYGIWHDSVQALLDPLFDALDEPERADWKAAIKCQIVEGKNTYGISPDSGKTIADLLELVRRARRPYPVNIVLDSPLAKVMGEAIGEELARSQPSGQAQPSTLCADFDAATDEEAYARAADLFRCGELANTAIGPHSIRFRKLFELPDADDLEQQGCIVVTGAGMCDGGPVVEHLTQLIKAKREFVFLTTGYQAAPSLGGRLAAIVRAKASGVEPPRPELEIGEAKFEASHVKARLIDFSAYYSGHADEDGLLDFVHRAEHGPLPAGSSTAVFINHGNETARHALKLAIESRAAQRNQNDRPIGQIHLPTAQQLWFNFDTAEWEDDDPSPAPDLLLRALLRQQIQTNALLRQLIALQPPARQRG